MVVIPLWERRVTVLKRARLDQVAECWAGQQVLNQALLSHVLGQNFRTIANKSATLMCVCVALHIAE